MSMKVMSVQNVHEVMLGISGMAGMISNGTHKKKGKKATTNAQKLEDLDLVVEWALKERLNLVGIQETMANGGVLRLSMQNIQEP